jgi:hypothetical protein
MKELEPLLGLFVATVILVDPGVLREFWIRSATGRLIFKYDLATGEVVKAHVAGAPKCPRPYTTGGEGASMISGASIGRCKKFKAERL